MSSYLGVPRTFRYPVIAFGLFGLWVAASSIDAIAWKLASLLISSCFLTLASADLYRRDAWGSIISECDGGVQREDRDVIAASNFFNMLHFGARLTLVLVALLLVLEKIQNHGILVVVGATIGILSVRLLDLDRFDM